MIRTVASKEDSKNLCYSQVKSDFQAQRRGGVGGIQSQDLRLLSTGAILALESRVWICTEALNALRDFSGRWSSLGCGGGDEWGGWADNDDAISDLIAIKR